eukprot:5480781-Amphidinium_carterae.1
MAAAADEDSASACCKPADAERKPKAPGLYKLTYKPISSGDYLREISPFGSAEEDADSFITAPGKIETAMSQKSKRHYYSIGQK